MRQSDRIIVSVARSLGELGQRHQCCIRMIGLQKSGHQIGGCVAAWGHVFDQLWDIDLPCALQPYNVIIHCGQSRFHLIHGGRLRRSVGIRYIKIADQSLGTGSKADAIVIDIAVKTGLPIGVDPFATNQNRRSRPYSRHRRDDLMQ